MTKKKRLRVACVVLAVFLGRDWARADVLNINFTAFNPAYCNHAIGPDVVQGSEPPLSLSLSCSQTAASGSWAGTASTEYGKMSATAALTGLGGFQTSSVFGEELYWAQSPDNNLPTGTALALRFSFSLVGSISWSNCASCQIRTTNIVGLTDYQHSENIVLARCAGIPPDNNDSVCTGILTGSGTAPISIQQTSSRFITTLGSPLNWVGSFGTAMQVDQNINGAPLANTSVNFDSGGWRLSGIEITDPSTGQPISGISLTGHNGRVFFEKPPTVLNVSIDIKPNGLPNTINLRSAGRIEVAVLSTPSFDAPSQVDKTSLTFGRTGDESSLAACNPPGDVNLDGLPDQVCLFEIRKAAFQSGDAAGVLRGKTIQHSALQGMDSVRIVP